MTEEQKVEILFTIGGHNMNTVTCVPAHSGLVTKLKPIFDGFPDHVWNKDKRGWNITASTQNIEYLHKTFLPSQYKVTEKAANILAYKELVKKVEEKRTAARWEYLFNDVACDWDPPHTRKPFMHQLVATRSMIGAECFGLLMEMGTGKTYCIALELNYYACKLHGNEMMRVVIVCPKGLRVNWKRELEAGIADTHAFAIEIIAGEMTAGKQLLSLLQAEGLIKIAIVSYDSVDTLLPQLAIFKPTYVCYDESHYVKNPTAQRSKACKALANMAEQRRILTGTPVSNNILDVWHQFELLRPGALGFSTYSGFKTEYAYVEREGGFERVVGFRDERIEKLKEDMAQISFVVKKERCLDLPQKIYEVRAVEMPDELRKNYDAMAKEFSMELSDGSVCETQHLIVQMLKLSQLACGIAVVKTLDAAKFAEDPTDPKFNSKTTFIKGGDVKMLAMLDDVEDVVANNSKVIIWSRFKASNRQIAAALKDRGIRCVVFDGDTDTDNKQANVDEFNKDDNCKVFIGNAQSGGVGLTLLGSAACPCNYAFFYSNSFSFGQRDQAEARNHRIGQKFNVLYRDYVYRDSIEEYIASVLKAKEDVSNRVKNVAEIKEVLLRGRGAQ